MTFKAAIFDMDGLLLDSERVCMECFLEAGNHIGYALNAEVYLSCIGSNQQRTKARLIAGHDDDFPYEKINKLWRELYFNATMEKPLPKKQGAEALLKAIAESNTSIALATSTAFEHAQIKLKNSQLAGYFDVVVAGDQVTNSKPDPEIYLKAASLLNSASSDCIAFEDSENGVRAALGAGLNVIQVPDLVQPTEDLKSLGHTIIDSLSEFRWTNR